MILAGVLIGSGVKRWMEVTRKVNLFQKDVARLGIDVGDNNAEFLKRAAGETFAGDNIAADFEEKRRRLKKSISSWKILGPLDKTNEEYQKALADLKNLQAISSQWPSYADDLEALNAALAAIREAKLSPPSGSGQPAAPQITKKQRLLESQPNLGLDAYGIARKQVTAATATATTWRTLLQQVLSQRDLVGDLNQTVPASPTDPGRIRLTISTPDDAYNLLWNTDDDASLTRVKDTLDRHAEVLEALRQKYSLPGPAPKADLVALQADLPEIPPEPETPHKVEAAKALAVIQLGDGIAFVIAVVVAVLTGLSQYYFDKPFGTLADYLKVFLWGIGSKMVVDAASLGLDKIVGLVGGKPLARVRLFLGFFGRSFGQPFVGSIEQLLDVGSRNS